MRHGTIEKGNTGIGIGLNVKSIILLKILLLR
jgi:hypothetical protein